MDTNNEKLRQIVREAYGAVAEKDNKCGCATDCCSTSNSISVDIISSAVGYSELELKSVPEGANMGLGCGNPQAIAGIKSGETVLDLGCGGGFDVFLASKNVGSKGKVIGVDMTPAMISKARENAVKAGYTNVEFRLGEIEHLPVADNSVDVIISNCVINLSPEKQKVFNDAFRVLKKGGRLAIADNIALKELPEKIKNDLSLYSACVSGTLTIYDLEKMLKDAGFEKISIQTKSEVQKAMSEMYPESNMNEYIASATIEAVKPAS